jgi:hypothetical protein
MAGEIAYKLTADEKAAIDAIRKVAEAYQGVEGGAKKATEETRKLQQEQTEMGRLAKRVMEEAQNPAEKYWQEIKKINQLFLDGKISVEAYEKASKKASDEMVAIGRAGDQAFGTQAIGHLRSFAAEMISTAAAIQGVKHILQEVGKIQEEASHHAKDSEFGFGSLAEVSGGDPERFKKNVATARHIAGTAGMSENQAARLTFALASAESMDEADTFAGAYKAGVVRDPETLLRASTAMRKAFGGRQTNRELLNQAFGAAEASPSKAAELLSASAGGAAYAKAIGVSEQELLAGTAVNATILDPAGGASVGGTAMKALLKSMGRMVAKPDAAAGITTDDEGHVLDDETKKIRMAAGRALAGAGPGLVSRLKALDSLGLDNSQLQKLFGRSEGLVAFRNILSNEGDYSRSLGRQAEAGRTDLFGKVLALPAGDTSIAAAGLSRIGESEKAESDRDYGTGRNLFGAVMAHEYAKSGWFGKLVHNVGDFGPRLAPAGQNMEMQHALRSGWLNDAPELRRAVVGHLGGAEQAFGSASDQRGIYEAAEKINRAADKFSAAVDRQHGGAPRRTLASPNGDPGDRK